MFLRCWLGPGTIIKISLMNPTHDWDQRSGTENLLVLLMGGLPIVTATALPVTLVIGSLYFISKGFSRLFEPISYFHGLFNLSFGIDKDD